MASQNLNVGSAANANDGDTLRAAFINVKKMFHEIYASSETYADSLDISGLSFDESIQDIIGAMVSGNTVSNITVTYDDTNGKLNFAVAADITDVNAGDGMTGTNESGGSATLNVVGGDGITVGTNEVEATVDGTTIELSATDGTGALRVKDDGITHDKLENRYTAVQSITTLTGAPSFDCSTASVFKLSGDLTGAYTIDLTGYKKGQVISIFPLKGQTVALDAQGTSTNTFNKLAESHYDNTVTSLLQIECVDDSATDPVFFYSVSTYASDNTLQE